MLSLQKWLTLYGSIPIFIYRGFALIEKIDLLFGKDSCFTNFDPVCKVLVKGGVFLRYYPSGSVG